MPSPNGWDTSRMKRIFYVFTFLHLFGFLSARAGGQVVLGELSRQDKARYAYFFQGAITRLSVSDEQGALDLLLHCKDIDPMAAETYFYLADCYEHNGNDSMRVAMLTRAAELQPENDVYKEELIPIYLNNNDIAKAAEIIEEIVAHTPERTDMLQMLVQIYNYQNEDRMTLDALNRLEVQDGQTEQITMAKVQLYTKMGDDKQAYKELKSLCDNHPLDLNYRVMLGNWLLGKDRKKEALAAYRAVLKEEPANESALMSMMDYYRAEGNDSLAVQQRDNLLFSPKTQQSTRLLLLKQFIREQELVSTDSTVVLELFDRVLSQNDDVEIMELKLAYMAMKEMPQDSLKTILSQILDKRPEHAQARFQLIQMAWEKQDYNDMVRLAEPALEFNPEEWSFSYFLGLAYVLNEQDEEAVKALQVASEHVDETSDKDLAAEMYNLLGEALHRTGRTQETYEAYDNCLRINPDKIDCLNNYAYYLAEEGGDLDKAAAMSQKTVAAEPTNVNYLDTYAWILYLQGRYEEARIYIDMTFDNLGETEDISVYEEHKKAIYDKLNK